MAKKRESIDDMIDAHVWMRRQKARLNRPLALDDVSDALLAENRPPHKAKERRERRKRGQFLPLSARGCRSLFQSEELPDRLLASNQKQHMDMLDKRRALYRSLEKIRDKPLLVYVTSTRGGSEGQMSADSVAEIQTQLQALPKGTKELDLLLASVGGDPTVAWRIVSLIRERCDKFSVLVPDAAYSAATLVVLGADEIVMHPNGNLGPTDPQITVPRKQQNDEIRFGSEDLTAYLTFVKENVSAENEVVLGEAFKKFCEDAGSSIAIGVVARGSRLSLAMGEKLLQLHMTGEAKSKAKKIAETLTKDFFHHGYPVNRSEAKEIGLKVSNGNAEVEDLMWRIWSNLRDDLRLREPFNPVGLLKANPSCAPLFAPVPIANLPANLPPDVLQQLVNQMLAQCGISSVPPTAFENVHALVESSRVASRFVTKGTILASRLRTLNFSGTTSRME
jgi:hypothetical protein